MTLRNRLRRRRIERACRVLVTTGFAKCLSTRDELFVERVAEGLARSTKKEEA